MIGKTHDIPFMSWRIPDDFYSTNHAVEDTFKVCPTCTWVLVTKGRNPFFGYRTPTDDQKLNGLLLFQFLLIFIFYGHVQNFLPLMETYHPMIYLL